MSFVFLIKDDSIKLFAPDGTRSKHDMKIYEDYFGSKKMQLFFGYTILYHKNPKENILTQNSMKTLKESHDILINKTSTYEK